MTVIQPPTSVDTARRRKKLSGVAVGLALLAAAAVPAQWAIPQTRPAALPRDPADAIVTPLLDPLASADFATREQAQKELARLDYHACAALRRIADGCADVEVKSRLLRRAAELEEQCAVAPPPISLTLDHADWPTMLTALRQATGTPALADAKNWNYYGHVRFSLDVHEKPFWEVLKLLAGQDSVGLDNTSTSDLRICQEQEHPLETVSCSGPCLFAPIDLTRTLAANYQSQPAVRTPSMTLRFLAAVDPRLFLVRQAPPRLVSVRDDAQNELLGQEAPQDLSNFALARVMKAEAALKVPEKPGRKIISAQGQWRMEVAVATTQMVVEDPAAEVQKSFQFHGHTITITRWPRKTAPVSPVFAVDVKASAAGAQGTDDTSVTFEMLHADGTVAGRMALEPSANGWYICTSGPTKLRLSVPTKTKLLEVPFEFKDLRIP
jgi:hypothetical protein